MRASLAVIACASVLTLANSARAQDQQPWWNGAPGAAAPSTPPAPVQADAPVSQAPPAPQAPPAEPPPGAAPQGQAPANPAQAEPAVAPAPPVTAEMASRGEWVYTAQYGWTVGALRLDDHDGQRAAVRVPLCAVVRVALVRIALGRRALPLRGVGVGTGVGTPLLAARLGRGTLCPVRTRGRGPLCAARVRPSRVRRGSRLRRRSALRRRRTGRWLSRSRWLPRRRRSPPLTVRSRAAERRRSSSAPYGQQIVYVFVGSSVASAPGMGRDGAVCTQPPSPPAVTSACTARSGKLLGDVTHADFMVKLYALFVSAVRSRCRGEHR